MIGSKNAPATPKPSLKQFLDKKMRIHLQGRGTKRSVITAKLRGFDNYMNLILYDCEEVKQRYAKKCKRGGRIRYYCEPRQIGEDETINEETGLIVSKQTGKPKPRFIKLMIVRGNVVGTIYPVEDLPDDQVGADGLAAKFKNLAVVPPQMKPLPTESSCPIPEMDRHSSQQGYGDSGPQFIYQNPPQWTPVYSPNPFPFYICQSDQAAAQYLQPLPPEMMNQPPPHQMAYTTYPPPYLMHYPFPPQMGHPPQEFYQDVLPSQYPAQPNYQPDPHAQMINQPMMIGHQQYPQPELIDAPLQSFNEELGVENNGGELQNPAAVISDRSHETGSTSHHQTPPQ